MSVDECISATSVDARAANDSRRFRDLWSVLVSWKFASTTYLSLLAWSIGG